MSKRPTGEEVRRNIVDTAKRLFYERGYNHTSFSDIADAAAVPRGNFYYYFKSKDDILAAVVAARLANIEGMLADWSARYPDARRRLKRFIEILLNEQQNILRFGCPIGSLNVELGKTQAGLQRTSVQLFEVFRQWLREQFRAIGRGRDADFLALHLLAATQGATLITSVYRDPRFLRREAARLREWVDGL
jgi:AcrR family transcriptional regulator